MKMKTAASDDQQVLEGFKWYMRVCQMLSRAVTGVCPGLTYHGVARLPLLRQTNYVRSNPCTQSIDLRGFRDVDATGQG